ncbi:MAG: hypothetical protein ACRES3_08120 [Steroidobacteraceae bacterium]
MNPLALRASALLALLGPLAALAGQPVDVEILDRATGHILPVYWHEGERHVAGEPGHEYEIRIHNHGHGRMLAVTSVDGVNVITGRTASPDQSGYVVDAYRRLPIDGWRKSMDQIAAFYFTSLPDSYAARTGRPDHVGVIGVALFREQIPYPLAYERESGPEPVPQARAERKSADSALGSYRDEARLGTGHGERRDSGATYTHFVRATDDPEAIIRIFYDSHRNLVARGVIPRPNHRFARRVPEPFPQGFVPDP